MTTIQSSKTREYYLELSVTEASTSVENNTSVINWSLAFKNGQYRYEQYIDTFSVMINGVTVYQKDKQVNFTSKNMSVAIESGSTTIKHNEDGTKNISFSASFTLKGGSASYRPAGNLSCSGNMSLSTIPRQSDFEIRTISELGSDVKLAIASNSASFVHKVEYYYQSGNYILATDHASTSYTFKPDLNLSSNTPNGDSGNLFVKVTTLMDTKQIGSPVIKSKTINVPASVKPSVSSISLERIDNGVPSSWGVYVKGYSKFKATMNDVSGKYNSSIKSYTMSGASQNFSSQTSKSFTSEILNTPGTFKIMGQVVDSRNRSSDPKYSSEFTVYDYVRPSISVQAQRCKSDGTLSSDGEWLWVKCSYNYADVGGKNTITKSVSCNNVSTSDFTNGEEFKLEANCSISNNYILTATIKDGLNNSSTVTITIPTDNRIMNIKKNGKGIAFGGFATKDDTLQCYYDLEVKGYKVTTIDTVYPIGSIYMSVLNSDPSHLFGGTWVRFGNGRVLVGVDENDSSFNSVQKTGGASTVSLTSAQLPAHSHTISHTHGLNNHTHSIGAHAHGLNSHTHTFSATSGAGGTHKHYYSYDLDAAAGSARYSVHRAYASGATGSDAYTETVSNHTHSVSGTTGKATGNTANSTAFTSGQASGSTAAASTSNSGSVGSGNAHNNLQPYITVYIWQRTA